MNHWRLPHRIPTGTRITIPGLFLLVFSLFSLTAQAADWKATEKIKTYQITGSSGQTLYASIGKKGPQVGGTRTIAHTTWDLKWRRDYQPRGTACVLVSAKPFFTIIYTVPKPASKMPAYTERRWKNFAKGILTHEKVHGVYAREMVDQIIANTVGLRVENDARCRKIRTEVLVRVKKAYADYKAKGREFDRTEMAVGGEVRRLVGELVK